MLVQLAYSRTNVRFVISFYFSKINGNMGLGYSQCLPGTSRPTSTSTARTGGSSSSTVTSTTSAPGSTTCFGTRTKFKYFGVNQSGAEFAGSIWPVSSIRPLLISVAWTLTRRCTRVTLERTTPGPVLAPSISSSTGDSTLFVFRSYKNV